MPERVDDVVVRRVRADDWQRVRALRLEALADPMAHVAFLETVEQAAARPDDEWRTVTARRADDDASVQFVGERGAELIGMLAVFVREAGVPDYFGRISEVGLPTVVGVYVSPSGRGLGVIDTLLASATEWARARGDRVLTLDVHESNLPAIHAYERAGFDVQSDFVGEHGRELGMVKELVPES
ncbi:MAG: GNAT family N-acetyltransferase [Acidobacteria bacterium]|nr:GNAT family N-acetyltransferase [Acidobacteriota bacterium]